MSNKEASPFMFQHIYPRMRHMMGLGRNAYQFGNHDFQY